MGNVDILFLSCDHYHDVWPITSYFFHKNWKDCPYKVYLGANGENRSDLSPEGWQFINTGPDESWSGSVAAYLEHIPSDHILLFLDDFLLVDKVNTEVVYNAIAMAQKNNLDYLRMNARFPLPEKQVETAWGLFAPYSPYRTSLQVALWKKEALRKLVTSDVYTPWEFEIYAGISKIGLKLKIAGVYHDIFSVVHCIEKGQWLPVLDNLSRVEEIEMHHSTRPMMTKKAYEAMPDNLNWKGRLFKKIPYLPFILRYAFIKSKHLLGGRLVG